MKREKRTVYNWMIAAVILGFTATTHSAHADAILISPGTGAGDDINNGGFESSTGTTANRTYAQIAPWFNFAGNNSTAASTDVNFKRTGTLGASVSTPTTGKASPGINTGHTIALGDTFDLSFWHRGSTGYTGTEGVTVTLYSTSGPIWSAIYFPVDSVWNEFTINNIAVAAPNIGEILFLRFVNNSGNNTNKFSGLDDITLAVSPKPTSFALAITPAIAPATGFDLEWESQAGKLYNLRTSTDLANPIAGWDLMEGDIVATPPANSKNVPADGARRFYAVEEFPAPPPPPLLLSNDVAFTASFDGSTQRYVLMVPADFQANQTKDLLIALHGHGSDRWQFAQQTRDECRAARDVAAAYGMIYASPDYRATTSWMGPAAEADVVQIIADLKNQFQIERVFVCGASMGGTSSLIFAALHPDLVAGAAAMNGTANMEEQSTNPTFQAAIAKSYGGTLAQIPAEYRKRSPEFAPASFTMPVGLTAGGLDTIVPPDSVLRLDSALAALGREKLMIYRPAGGHSTDYADARAILEFVIEKARR